MTWLLLLLLTVLASALLLFARVSAAAATSAALPLLLLAAGAVDLAIGLSPLCCADMGPIPPSALIPAASAVLCRWLFEAERCIAAAERGPTPAVAAARWGL
jgi:hypothetical protein